MTNRAIRAFGLALGLALVGGCDNGPKRYTVEGAVTFDGTPVPSGEVAFEPDSDRGNKGPGSVARIVNGRYKTEDGMGVVGGPYVVRVTPFDGKPNNNSYDGNPLVRAPHVVKLDLPAESTTKDFDVPKSAGRK